MVLLTGASGFLGRTIYNTLSSRLKVDTLNRSHGVYNYVLERQIPEFNEEYQVVIHAAGKAHSLPKSPLEGQQFFDVNVMGTYNLLYALQQYPPPKSFVFISTVAVYGLNEGPFISEQVELSAKDPYGQSKIQAEYLIQEWCAKHNVICSILRLPLIAGPNPPGNLKSMIKGIKKGYYFDISGGGAKKSIVLAKDVANIIPKAAEIGGVYNLTDGCHPTFAELSALIAMQLGKRIPPSIPGWIARMMAKAGDFIGPNAPINSSKLSKITSDLTFDDSKARQLLGWNPTPVLEGFKIT